MNLEKLIPLLIPVILLQVTLIIISLINLLPKVKTKYLNKAIWVVIIIFLNIIGPTIYLLVEGKDEDESSN